MRRKQGEDGALRECRRPLVLHTIDSAISWVEQIDRAGCVQDQK